MSNSLSLDSLKEQLKATEQEFEAARSHLYRCDGVIQLLKNQIASLETPADTADEKSDEKPSKKDVKSKEA